MNKSPLTFLFAFGFVFVNSVSYAGEGWYFGSGTDGVYLDDSDIIDVTALGAERRYDIGADAGPFVGYDFGNNLRVEGELGFRRNGADEVAVLGSRLAADGSTETVNLMANLSYDFASDGPLKPYVGAGVGLAFISLDEARNLSGAPIDEAVVAYQVGAGIGFAFSSTVAVSLDYRFFTINDPKFSAAGAPFEVEDVSHSLGVHMKFRF
ncbi:MAG: outer membrane beta-barrel protein [Alphaproteobacteria bacterium]